MQKNKLYFDVYGHYLTLDGPEPLLAAARDKFADFAAPPTLRPESPATVVYARLSPPARPNSASLLFKNSRYSVYLTRAGLRLITYGDLLSCHCNFKKGIFVINSGDEGHLEELLYLLMHSRFGEFLDAKGIHRLHAGALSLDGRTLAVTGAPGAGKTTLLLSLLEGNREARLISDDVTLLDSELNLYPLPLRISVNGSAPDGSGKISRLDGKTKYSLDKSLFETEKKKRKLNFLVFVEKSGKPGIKEISFPRAFLKLFLPLVVGYGVPQMAEFLLKFNLRDLSGLARISLSRFYCALRLSLEVKCYLYLRSADGEKNGALISEFRKKAFKI
ncbi:MAG: hypothetical protein COT17_01735 [Elusimicrobia bacterium CG08_land_8_20_14_0_20_51_18]|nr:MAG: hypothetical protein COT17_01735 [Elusimicrobia bacterium CG08_land_8_20_14_0_20_51_18]